MPWRGALPEKEGALLRPIKDAGLRMLKLIGLGHSNLKPPSDVLKELAATHPSALSYTGINLMAPKFRPEFRLEEGKYIANPAWMQIVETELQAGPATLFLYLRGARYWHWSLTPGPRPFDFVEPEREDAAALLGEIIPYSLMQAQALSACEVIKRFVEVLRQVTQQRLMHFLPPPPVVDVAARIKMDTAELKQILAEYGFSQASFRLKMWRLCAWATRETCAALDVDCIEPPSEARDENGFLRPEYDFDGLHGNIAWGRLLCRRLLPENLLAEGETA